ncbi:MAG: hypothetical protein ACOY82_07745 [Pseudomonadota bacterium]
MKRPNPPVILILLTLSSLAFEAWLLFSNPNAGTATRFGMVSALMAGVLYEQRIAVAIWMIWSLFMALFFFSSAFRSLEISTMDAGIGTAGALIALCNAGYLFFFHSFRTSSDNGDA